MNDKKNKKVLNDLFNNIPEEDLELTRISLDIAIRLQDILRKKNMTQKSLAGLMGKKESEISRWMKGMHNFTTKTIAKLQVKLGEKIIEVPNHLMGIKHNLPKARINETQSSGNWQPLKIVHPRKQEQNNTNAA